MKQKKEKRRIVRQLRNKFRMVIINDDTFEERASLRLSPLNIVSWGGIIIIFLIILVTLSISFTPLREYIPGYADVETRINATRALLKADSLQRELLLKDQYLRTLKAIISGEPLDTISDSTTTQIVKPDLNALLPSKEDSSFRQRVENEEKFNVVFQDIEKGRSILGNTTFFPPIKGIVTDSFDIQKNHFGVDVTAPANEVVKSTLDGTVIFAEWTYETGNVLHVQHKNELISIYKHNSVLLKKTGDKVEAGEAVAVIGETGEFLSGPHLHFELWYKGSPIDPSDYVVFEN